MFTHLDGSYLCIGVGLCAGATNVAASLSCHFVIISDVVSLLSCFTMFTSCNVWQVLPELGVIHCNPTKFGCLDSMLNCC